MATQAPPPETALFSNSVRCHRGFSQVLNSPPSRCRSESQRVRNWNVAATSPEGSGVITSSSLRLSRGCSAWPQQPGPTSSSKSTASGMAAAIPAAASASRQHPRPPNRHPIGKACEEGLPEAFQKPQCGHRDRSTNPIQLGEVWVCGGA